MAGRQAKGMAIVNLLNLQNEEKVTAAFPMEDDQEGRYLVMATKMGQIKKTKMSQYENIRSNGLIAMGIREDDDLCAVFMTEGDDEIIVGTHNGMSIRFSEKDIRPMDAPRMAYGPSTSPETMLSSTCRRRICPMCWRSVKTDTER